MLFKRTASVSLLALTCFVNSQSLVTFALGVTGNPEASDVHQTSGTVASYPSLKTSIHLSIQADKNGEFRPSIINFVT